MNTAIGILIASGFAGGIRMTTGRRVVGAKVAGRYTSVFAGTRTKASGLTSTGIVTGTARNVVVGLRTTGSQTHRESLVDGGRVGGRTARGSRMVSLRSQVTSAQGPRTSA